MADVTTTKGSRVGKVSLIIVLIVVILLAVAEFGLRAMMSQQLKESTSPEASISFGASPLLVGIATKNLPSVTIDTPEMGESPRSHITMKNLDIHNSDAPIAEQLELETTLSDAYLLAAMQNGLAENTAPKPAAGELDLGSLLQSIVKVTAVTTQPAEKNITIEFTDGAASLQLKPVVDNGSLGFEAVNANLLGFDLPQSVSDALTQQLSKQAGDSLHNMTISNVDVIEGGMNLTLNGNNVNLAELEN